MYNIRIATTDDAPSMLAIYAPIVESTAISFELEVPTLPQFEERIASLLLTKPWIVATYNDAVIGYAYAGNHRDRKAYQWATELSAYVHPNHQKKGVARALYTALIEMVKLQGFQTAFAGIALPNPASIAFHQNIGFQLVGTYHQVGFKGGKWQDVSWWELPLKHDVPPSPPILLSEVLHTPAWQNAIALGLQLLQPSTS